VIKDHGAHFYRCDFQVHTPRDAQWKSVRPSNEVERRTYAMNFVTACRKVGLNAVAITDHHDLAMLPLIRDAAQEETTITGEAVPKEEQLVIFPGVELTLAVPCQALLILDADFPSDLFSDVLKILNIDEIDHSAVSLPPTNAINIDSFQYLHVLLDQRSWLKGRYIIFPNMSDGGYKTLLRNGLHHKYKEMPCVGGYLDGSIEKLGRGNQNIISGQDANWGNKPVGIFQTSDSRSDDFVKLGLHSTWVKWASPTAEALRQACLARESRISQTVPQLPGIWILRLVVTNSKFMGPIDITFNSQYNAVIGGRGTGKSTLLDYLRWGLCDQPTKAGAEEEAADPSTRQRRLIETTLTPFDVHVEVHFSINDIRHIVRRYTKTGEVTLKIGDQDFAKTSESDIRTLLPIHAYSQKQLSSVAVRLDELTRFVTAPIKTQLDEFDRQIAEASGRLRENYATLQRYNQLKAGVTRSVLTARSLAEQAMNLRRALTGLSESDRTLLNEKPVIDSLRATVNSWDRQLDQVRESGKQLLGLISASISTLASATEAPSQFSTNLEAIRLETAQILETFRNELDLALQNSATRSEASRSTLHQKVIAMADEFDTTYASMKVKSTAHEARLSELAEIEDREKTVNERLQQQRYELKDVGTPRQTHIYLRQELVALLHKRSACLNVQCEALAGLSDGLLRAHLHHGQGLEAIESCFRTLIAGSGVRSSKVEALFTALHQESDPISTWETLLEELEFFLLRESVTDITSEMTPVLTRLGIPLTDQKKLLPKISPDGWLDLALTPITDHPEFGYKTKEGEFIEFALASAGQQATALLRVLLAQTGMPLIIDQPEDDLDSQVIQDVVQRIWRAKRGRQLIFSSHNANLVVNGDAELVIACDYRFTGDQSGGIIKLEGAIDVLSIRNEITHVMEGGEKAFRLRMGKYGF